MQWQNHSRCRAALFPIRVACARRDPSSREQPRSVCRRHPPQSANPIGLLPTQIAAHLPSPKSLALRCEVRLLDAGQLRYGGRHFRPLCRSESTEPFCSLLWFSSRRARRCESVRLCNKHLSFAARVVRLAAKLFMRAENAKGLLRSTHTEREENLQKTSRQAA